MQSQFIALADIRIDGETQSRARLDDEVVAEYAEAYGAGKSLPPVILYFDGSSYWLADGFHRYFGRKHGDFSDVEAEVRAGTRRDAILYSVGANAHHGLRRSNEDKRRAVATQMQAMHGAH